MTAPPPDGVDCSPVSRCQFCDLPVLSGEIVRVIEGKSYHAPSHCVDRLRARVTELEAQTQEALRLYGAALNEKSSIVQLLDQRTALLQELRSWNTSEWVKPSFRELLDRVDASLPKAAARSAP